MFRVMRISFVLYVSSAIIVRRIRPSSLAIVKDLNLRNIIINWQMRMKAEKPFMPI